ncbi:MAG: glycosyltransferase family 4 protein [Terriglobales bacterium]
MRIGLDAHCLGGRKTGNETYTRELVAALGSMAVEDEFHVFVTRREQLEQMAAPRPGLRYHLLRPAHPALRMAFGWAMEARRRKLDVLHFQYFLPAMLPCRSVLMVHDISHERYPEFFPRNYRLLSRLIRQSCRRADWVLTVSEYSKCEIVELYRIPPERVTVTYNGCPSGFQPVPHDEALQRVKKYGIEDSYLLYVGTLQPRKNLPRLLAAYAECRRRSRVGQKLVIAGKKEWLFSPVFHTIREQRLEADVVLTGYVDHEDLPSLYSAADAFVYPSIYEGFGLPVVEAMACGTPVLTSYGSSLEEIAHGAALLANPLSVGDIALGLDRIANDRELRQKLARQGRERARKFSFRQTAEQTWDVFQRVCGAARCTCSTARD